MNYYLLLFFETIGALFQVLFSSLLDSRKILKRENKQKNIQLGIGVCIVVVFSLILFFIESRI